jgi:predicted RNase H-like nuclease (RuvC/YqgF family)
MQKISELESELTVLTESNQRLVDELQNRSEQQDGNVNLQQTIHDLEEQLDTLSRSERLAQQRIKQLEEEVRNLRNLEEVGITDDSVHLCLCITHHLFICSIVHELS